VCGHAESYSSRSEREREKLLECEVHGTQKAFNVIGWFAFALLLPPVLEMFKLPQLQDLVSDQLRAWGSPVALVIYFYAILFLRVFSVQTNATPRCCWGTR